MIQETEEAQEIEIQLQFRSKIPLTDQVRRGIFELIQQGKLREAHLLPTVRQLAAQFGVNFNTVARAYRALDQEGWLITRQGRGTVVSKPVREKAEDPFEAQVKRLLTEVRGAAEALSIAPEELLQAIKERMNIPDVQEGNEPISIRKKPKIPFRPYLSASPRSRKTRKETLDWRLRKPNRKGGQSR